MKKHLFLTVLCCLFASTAFAQSSPLAPKDYQSKVINSTLLYKAIRDVNIPVYLTSARNVSIQYCWYNTSLQFGNSVRASEEPTRIEQGSYTNGRLSTYTKGSMLYQISWSPNGQITAIHAYSSDGDNRGSCTISGMYWVDYKSIRSKGKGLSSSKSIYISHVLLYDEYADSTLLRLQGYYISSEWLCDKCVEQSLGKVRGQIAKGWRDHSWTRNLVKINSDGSFDGNQCFDFRNSSKCAYYEF